MIVARPIVITNRLREISIPPRSVAAAAEIGSYLVTERELLLDCVRRLNAEGVAYTLTGSMASNAWGLPRTTHVLDFIQLPPSQIHSFMRTFVSPDYYLDEAALRAAHQPPYQFNLIHVPSALKADFWLLRPVPFEREMFSRRRCS